MRHLRRGGRRAALVYGLTVLAAVGLTGIASRHGGSTFARYLGEAVRPTTAVALVGAVGAFCLAWLDGRHDLVVVARGRTRRGAAVSVGLAGLFGAAVVLADVVLRYPAEMNVAWPSSLVFYPAIGFVAEVGFHVVPLTLVLLALGRLAPFVAEERASGIALWVAAAVEPAFQVLLADDPTAGTTLYTAVHVFAISAVQLEMFRRFDFVSMLVLRLAYYAVWHVGWGAIRLQVLF